MAGSIVSSSINHRPRGIIKIKAVLTADASGDATVTTVGAAFGRLVAVGYKPGTLATGADITVTDADTAATIFSLTDAGVTARYFRPTVVITTNAGVAVTAAATATGVDRDLYLAGKVKIVVAQGGNLGAGELYLIVDEGPVAAQQ